MSLGQAIFLVSHYTSKMEDAETEVRKLETQLEVAVKSGDDTKQQQAQEQLTKNKILFDLYKGFVEFWKEVIKATKELIKSLNELAFSR